MLFSFQNLIVSWRSSTTVDRSGLFGIVTALLTETLRLGTRSHHDRIEQQLGLPYRVTSRQEYAALLAGFYGFYGVIEPELLTLLAEAPEFRLPERQKTDLLRRDLVALGWTEEAIAAVPLCDTPPDLDSLPQALGCLYVLEGSTLGGQVISAHFRRTLGVNEESGGRYFHGYGSQTAGFWRAFKEALLNHSQRFPENDMGILESARATFSSLESWLCQGPRV